MNRMASLLTIVLLGVLPMQSIAQGPPEEMVTPNGKVITPPTSIENPGDHGQRGHTNHLIVVPQKGLSRSSSFAFEATDKPPVKGYGSARNDVGARQWHIDDVGAGINRYSRFDRQLLRFLCARIHDVQCQHHKNTDY